MNEAWQRLAEALNRMAVAFRDALADLAMAVGRAMNMIADVWRPPVRLDLEPAQFSVTAIAESSFFTDDMVVRLREAMQGYQLSVEETDNIIHTAATPTLPPRRRGEHAVPIVREGPRAIRLRPVPALLCDVLPGESRETTETS